MEKKRLQESTNVDSRLLQELEKGKRTALIHKKHRVLTDLTNTRAKLKALIEKLNARLAAKAEKKDNQFPESVPSIETGRLYMKLKISSAFV